MRMDQNSDLNAFTIANTYSEKELAEIFNRYGEIRNANTLASAVVSARINHPIRTTADLLSVVKKYSPPRAENQYAAQVFQAIRIEVNDEIRSLGEFLVQTPDLLKKGGRLVVISYHSLEDRLVKNLMVRGAIAGEAEKDIFGNQPKPFRPVTRKPMVPSREEINRNGRARSAKLRIAEKI